MFPQKEHAVSFRSGVLLTFFSRITGIGSLKYPQQVSWGNGATVDIWGTRSESLTVITVSFQEYLLQVSGRYLK